MMAARFADQPAVEYGVPCPECGAGNPVAWPHDHPKFHPLEIERMHFVCAACGSEYVAERDETGRTTYATHPNAEGA